MIRNPILRGFRPDPAILRHGDDYFIVNSTFEWFPGLEIHHSKDLKHWRLLTHALTRKSQLDLARTAPSQGIWAPCLTYDERDSRFYLCYTLVHSLTSNFFDLDNFLVTAPSIEGPWSNPIYLNSSGFDPSLLHDADGRQWLVSMVWDFREGYEHPGYICLQEYSRSEQRLIGERYDIYHSKELGCVEGPHLYQRNGYYYLMTAEGGTGYGHACMLSRSSHIQGPYEPSPYNPLFTSTSQKYNGIEHLDYKKAFLYNPDSALQKCGHGSLVETQTGESYVAHICARPLLPELRCVLGRETALQKVKWTSDGWLKLACGGHLAKLEVPEPNLPAFRLEQAPARDDFDKPVLNLEWSSLRQPVEESWASLTARPGYLRLRGRESLCSRNKVSLIARRIQSFHFQAETCVDYEPKNFQQMAGLACLYDDINHYYLRIYRSSSLKSRCLGLMSADNGIRSEHLDCRVAVPETGRLYLRVVVHGREMIFHYSLDGAVWSIIGPMFDASKLSDEYCANGQFTGAFVGITVQDFYLRQSYADFDYCEYLEMRS
jgi:xylan 1,4-beta-xylosidase